jgi:hypothetical protein
MSESWLALGVEGALAANADAVDRWQRDEPGAWGHVAGQAVLACRRELGRALTEAERRLVWSAAWQALQGRREHRGPSIQPGPDVPAGISADE